jgi:hypothetical protein
MNCTAATIGSHRCDRFGPDCWALLDSTGAVVGWFAELADVASAVGGEA